jgi:hypothetical protein
MYLIAHFRTARLHKAFLFQAACLILWRGEFLRRMKCFQYHRRLTLLSKLLIFHIQRKRRGYVSRRLLSLTCLMRWKNPEITRKSLGLRLRLQTQTQTQVDKSGHFAFKGYSITSRLGSIRTPSALISPRLETEGSPLRIQSR